MSGPSSVNPYSHTFPPLPESRKEIKERDKAWLKKAIDKSEGGLQYASEALRNDPEVVKVAALLARFPRS